jgi:hypothetical protein
MVNEHELLEWVHDHRESLHEISACFGAGDRVTRGLALMVLSGYSDADVYADLGHEILVWDAQHSRRSATRGARRSAERLAGP